MSIKVHKNSNGSNAQPRHSTKQHGCCPSLRPHAQAALLRHVAPSPAVTASNQSMAAAFPTSLAQADLVSVFPVFFTAEEHHVTIMLYACFTVIFNPRDK